MLRIFTPVKIQRLWPGLNPRTWVPEVSMLTTRPSKPSSEVIFDCWQSEFILDKIKVNLLYAAHSEDMCGLVKVQICALVTLAPNRDEQSNFCSTLR